MILLAASGSDPSRTESRMEWNDIKERVGELLLDLLRSLGDLGLGGRLTVIGLPCSSQCTEHVLGVQGKGSSSHADGGTGDVGWATEESCLAFP